MAKEYAGLSTLQTFLDNLKSTFATLTHKHTLSDISDYVVDTDFSSTSSNPIANKTVDAEFEAIAIAMNALESSIDDKANASHTHEIADVNNLQSTISGIPKTADDIKAVSYDVEQTLTDEQKAQARENVGVVQPDLTVNNPDDPAYVKGRTHWISDPVESVAVEETSIEITSLNDSFDIPHVATFIEDMTYYITYDEVVYECVARNDGWNDIYVGNQQVMQNNGWNWGFPETIESSEPFFIFSYDGNVSIVASEIGTHTISIVGMLVEVHKIPKKYLPGRLIQPGTGTLSEVFNSPNNVASGQGSHAEGYGTTASGMYSHAEGGYDGATDSEGNTIYTEASDYGAHAEGSSTKAINYGAHAEGILTTASGRGSHAEGWWATASGTYSHAEGNSTTASGKCAHAEGYQTTASGIYSHAEGYQTTASSDSQHTQGKYNIQDTENIYAHIIGNGTSSTALSNAHTLDWNGVGWFKGGLQVGGTAQDDGAKSVMLNGDTEIILASSTEGSTKKFKITIDDTGTLTVSEIVTEEVE